MAKFFNFFLEINFKKIVSKYFFLYELPISNLFFKNKTIFLLFYIFSINKNNITKYFLFNLKNNRLNKKIQQISQNNFYKTNNNNYFFYKNFFEGFKYFFISIRFWILPIFIFFMISLFLCFTKIIPFYKFSFTSFVLLSFFY